MRPRVVEPPKKVDTLPEIEQNVDRFMRPLGMGYYFGMLGAAKELGVDLEPEFLCCFLDNQKAMKLGQKNFCYFRKVREIYSSLLVEIMRPYGPIKFSGPLLTAYDLIRHQEAEDDFGQVIQAIQQLASRITPEDIHALMKFSVSLASFQRLGYIFYRLDYKHLSDATLDYKAIFSYCILFNRKDERRYVSTEPNPWHVIDNVEWDKIPLI